MLLVAAVCVIWIKCPEWLTSGESASTTLRNMGLLVAAAIGLPLAIWRSVIAERQAEAARRQSEIAMRNLLNERFQEGAAMLGNIDIGSVRIGGVHALARLASEYPEEFHLPVMQLFSAFVVDRTRSDAKEQGRTVITSIERAREEPSKGESGVAESNPDSISKSPRDALESAGAEFLGPFFAADRELGPVPELAKDVREVMSQIAQRNNVQIELEREKQFRMDFADASLPGLIFHEADFSSFDFTKADLRRVRCWSARFSSAVLPGADLSGANMNGADFRDADMRRINLTAARLKGANLSNAKLGCVDRVGQNLWNGALFPSRLRGVQLQGADLRGADFGGADMRGASLGAARLEKSSLGGADLSGADLRAAKLGSANLLNASLEGAILSGTDFSHDWRSGKESPARGLTQRQLDTARADSGCPPLLDGVVDSETGMPLSWKGDGAVDDA